jgi:hypothetical protein
MAIEEFVIEDEPFNVEKHIIPQYSWWERLFLPSERVWYWLVDKWNSFRYHCQRFQRGYGDYDVWNFQMWLVHMLKPMLENMINHLYTHPEELTSEQWHAILQDMVHLLALMDADDEKIIRQQLGIDADDRSYQASVLIMEERNRARGRFFELLNRWYWDLRY